MKEKLGIIFFVILLPAVTSIGLLIYLNNKENGKMIEVDVSAIIVAIISAFVTLLGIIIVEIVGWRKAINRLKQQEKAIGVNENRVCLSQQHDNISNQMRDYQKEIKTILKDDIIKDELNSSHSTLTDIHRIIKDNDRRNKYRDSAILAVNEAKMAESHNYINDLFNRYADALNEVKELKKVISEQQDENQGLKDKVYVLTLSKTELENENRGLKAKLEETRQRFEQYVQQTQGNGQDDDWELDR